MRTTGARGTAGAWDSGAAADEEREACAKESAWGASSERLHLHSAQGRLCKSQYEHSHSYTRAHHSSTDTRHQNEASTVSPDKPKPGSSGTRCIVVVGVAAPMRVG